MQREDSSEQNEDPIERWYWVKATYKGVHVGAARRRHLWQTIVFLIRGVRSYELPHPASVWRKADEVARQKEHQYEASDGHTVRWVLQHVEAMAPLVDDAIGEGTEVYWEFYEKVDKKPPGSAQDGESP
jgi:hypothetical protein